MQKNQRPKKIPQRRCVGCNESQDKKNLIRVVRQPNGTVTTDRTGKLAGRGAYLCYNVACLQKAKKAKRLENQLACQIEESVYLLLQKELESHDGAN